jgi:hypothetical protein
LVHLENGKYHIVSRYDVISAISWWLEEIS